MKRKLVLAYISGLTYIKGKALAEDNNHQEALKAFERVIQLTRRLYAPRPLSVPRARAKAEADGKAIRINKEYSVEAYCYIGSCVINLEIIRGQMKPIKK